MKKQNEPIAIVGIGCRYPGEASSPEKFWDLLVNKKDAIIDIPTDRWDYKKFYDPEEKKSGKMRMKQGGFLKEGIKNFDPLFFGISPVEAEDIDPQVSLLLQVAYEAMEDSGVTMQSLKGSRTGVFVGGFTVDNYITKASQDNRNRATSHTSLGAPLTMLSNRISYCFDLKGPSITIDTACSSSLVATHYACQSIWNGESDRAIVGGVNAMLIPQTSVLMSQGKFLSKHARCKTFDSDAGGYVRGEGAGVVMLKSYDQALKDGDRIYALINGTGVNQDGQTNGITVPNQDSQIALMKEVYENAGINIKDIEYVEAHGTGTPVGDPLEFGAINKVMSENHDANNKVFIGSVKSNIGHLEAGAGVAGLIKAALCLHKNQVPANLHFNTPNPELDYENSVLKVPTSLEELSIGKESFASINSFGFGGTNAHVLLKQASIVPEKNKVIIKKDNGFLFPITAKSKSALIRSASDFRDYIGKNPDRLAEILSNVSHRRTFHSNRLGIYATSQEDLIDKLEAFEEDLMIKGVAYGTSQNKKPKVAYVYTGMGPQWWKMGRELMEKEPVFLEAIQECDKHFIPIAGWSILEELNKPEEDSKVKDTNIAQTANFVIQVGLTKLLDHYGVKPDAVVGHSVGEVTSLYISGALTLKDALLVSYHRSRLQHTTEGSGGMLAVGLSEEGLEDLLKDYPGVSIAAINSNTAVTLAGDQNSLDELSEKFKAMNVFNKALEVAVPYHSPKMDPIKDELLASLKTLQGKETNVELYSTVTAEKITGKEINNQYWWRNVRESVRFAQTFETMMNDEYKVFVEIGPHPVLKNSMMECAGETNDFQFLQTLNRKEAEEVNFYENLASLFTLGFDLKWNNWVDKSNQISLPKYNWEKMTYWSESKESSDKKFGLEGNKFLNYQVDSPLKTYKTDIDSKFFPFIEDHIVQDKIVFPGTGYIAAAIALHQKESGNDNVLGLENIKFHQLLALEEDQVQNLYVSLDTVSNKFEISSREEGDETPWFKRATGKCIFGKFTKNSNTLDIPSLFNQMDSNLSKDEVYDKLDKAQLHYGPYFRGIDTIKFNDKEAVAKIVACEAIKNYDNEHLIHPGLLDSCFQTMIVFDTNEDVSIVPVSIERMMCYSSPGVEFTCHTRLKSKSFDSVIADITIYNEKGEVAITLEGIKCQEIASKTSNLADDFPDNSLYEVNWVEESVKVELNQNSEKVYVIITDDFERSEALRSQLGGRVLLLQPGTALRELGEDHYEINLQDAKTISALIGDHNGTDLELMYFSEVKPTTHNTLLSTDECLEYINPLLGLIRYLSDAFPSRLTLNLVTSGAQVVYEEDEIHHLGTSVYIGLGRLMSNEFPNWKIRLIDFEGKDISADTWRIALGHINADKRIFEEITIRENKVFKKVMRKRQKPDKLEMKQTVSFKETPLELVAPEFSELEDLFFKEVKRLNPEDQEVEILIENTSVNFKDYLKVTNRISSEAFEGTNSEDQLGIDCEGTVVKVGKKVTKFKVGEKVIAMSKGAFKSYTTVNENLVAKSPKSLADDGSHILSPYLTAIYCLRNKGGLKQNDRVLIHNATGAVGLASINYAKMVGAEIFATAGSDEKREYLKSMGIDHVFNSMDLDFSNKISEITEGEGVDVILSSLSGEMLYQSLEVLAPYGTYIEIGKLSALEDLPLPMKVFKNNLSFISVDLDQLCKDKPEVVCDLANEIVNYIDNGNLKALPTKIFDAKNIAKAFEWIQQRNYIGKVVVNFKGQSVEIENAEKDLFNTDSTYLITGGTRGLGLEIAHWMINKGVKNLALLSRSGEKDPKVKARIDSLRQRGANINVYGVDVTNLAEMRSVFSDIDSTLPPLVGIFHGAMVLDDGFLLDMTDDRFRKVLKPKVDGTVVLHELSKNYPIDLFVMFSSLSSLTGHLGQANYVIANTVLDSFTYLRKSQGLPATTVNLGVLGESGVISRDQNLKEMVLDAGINSFTNEEVLLALEEIVRTKPTQIGFFNLDWNIIGKSIKKSKSSLFEELIQENMGNSSNLNEEQITNRDCVLSADQVEQGKLVVDLLTEELSTILKMPKDQIAADKGVNFLGVDSILSVQLIRAINSKLAVELSPMEFTSGPNLRQLSRVILDKVKADSSDNVAIEV